MGRYELREEIARGGMGVVFRAYDHLARREIAYKRLLVEHRRSQARRAALFEREYNALVQLSHPNIVQVYEYGIDAHAPYYTMELLPGSDLHESAPLPIGRACAVLREVASALALVHARRLVHRDVSPVNVRLTAEGNAKLIDFGALAGFGRATEIVGTPSFVAPECLTGRALDPRADLFSFGALAYWVLTRKRAFAARSIEERVLTLGDPVVPPSAHQPEISRELDGLVLSLLRVDPMERPASAAEVMERLTVIGDLPAEPNQRQVAYSYLAHPPFVGREREFEQVRERLRRVMAGRGGTLAIAGAAGLGRTALLEQLAIEAQLAGATVLRGQGSGEARPFGVAQALVRAGVASYPALAERGHLDSLFPANPLQARAESTPVAAVARHTRTLQALQGCLTDMSREQPLVILIDDAHRVDSESMAVFASLASNDTETPILMGLTVPDQMLGRGDGALGKLLLKADKIALHTLAPESLAELVSSIFGNVPNARRLSLWLTEHSGGNPAMCMSLLRKLLLHDIVRYVTGTFVLPHDIQSDLNLQDTDASLPIEAELSEAAREVAQTLALQDQAIGLSVLAAAAKLDGPAALQGVEEMRARGLVQLFGDRVLMAQEAVRASFSNAMTKTARREAHLRIGRALQALSRDRDTQMLASLNLLRGGAEDEGAQMVAELAREQALSPDAHSTDIAVLEEALQVMRNRGRSDAQCLPILVALVRSGYFGDYLAQRRHLDRALSVLLDLSGLGLALRLKRFVGVRFALYLGLLLAAIHLAVTPREKRVGSFQSVLSSLVTLASGGVAASVSAFDPDQARHIVEKLSPLGAFRNGTAPRVAYEFAMASFESGSGNSAGGGARYAALLEQLEAGSIRGLDESAQAVYRLGCLYGLAQAELSKGSVRALQLADEVQGGHAFYAPHAETTRMAYYAYRGEEEQAEHFRERAELAALRGGMSWSAVTIVTVRSMYAYIWSRNVIGLVRVIPELERLSHIAPNLALYRDLARGYLALLRGRPDKAMRLYERVLADPRHPSMPTRRLDQTYYAEALCELKRFEDAKRVCLEVLAQDHNRDADLRAHIPVQQLALAEAGLGEHAAAALRLERCLEALQHVDSPMLLGSIHRDRAHVALLSRDEAKFAEHLQEMSAHYRRTHNPWLIRQCEELSRRARQAGVLSAAAAPVGLDPMQSAVIPSSGLSPFDVQPTVSDEGPLFSSDPLKPTTVIAGD